MVAKETAKLTSKGQITLPKGVRRRLGLETGDEIEFIDDGKGYRLKKKKAEESPFDKWSGYFQGRKGTSTDELIEQMRGR